MPAFGGFNVSGVYPYTTGLAWGRLATIRGLTQGNEVVRIEPRGTRRTDPINLIDVRVEKTFPIGSNARQVGVYLDLFNLNNFSVSRRNYAAMFSRNLARWIAKEPHHKYEHDP